METIYKSDDAKKQLMDLYDTRLRDSGVEVLSSEYVDTFAGPTHVIQAGNPEGKVIVVLHGIHAGAPMALEAITDLLGRFRVVAVDTVGQATRSAETVLSMKDNSYGRWLAEVLDGLGLEKVDVVGVSYGGFILSRLLAYAPERVSKAIYVVPMGMVSVSPFRGAFRLSIPLVRYMLTKKDKHLAKFMEAFYGSVEQRDLAFQRALLTGVKMDYRRPPLISESEGEKVEAPVYIIAADDDVFIPDDKAVDRCRSIFPNFKEAHVIRSKHIPNTGSFGEICEKIDEWVGE